MTTRNTVLRTTMLLGLFAGISCDESLPPYRDPRDVLEATQESLYVISRTDNSLKIILSVVNMFDDTFDAKAFIDGTVTAVLSTDQTFRKTFSITANNMILGKYNSTTKNLIVNPLDTVRLLFSWDFIDDNGRDIRDMIGYHKDPMCQGRWISNPLTFSIRGEVKLYEKINFTAPQTIFPTITHVREFYDTKNCTPLPGF